MNEQLIKEAIQARIEIENWLRNRPNVGLDVTDVDKLVAGFDYFGYLLFGKDVKMIGEDDESIEVRR